MVQLQSEVRRLEGELDTVRRERDALQLEMSLVQVSSGLLGVSVVGNAGLSTHSDFLGIVETCLSQVFGAYHWLVW